MVSELAKGDWEDLKAQGLNPTLEDFDRLNQLALRIKDGEETTAANFPRIGWAGDVPFFEPTLQVFDWYYRYAVRAAANAETELSLWAFALAHAREPGFFAELRTPDAISRAAGEWAAALPVTRDEVLRACRYAARGFDDAEPAKPESGGSRLSRPSGSSGNPCYRADVSAAARNLANLESQLASACAALHVAPGALMCETQSRLDALRHAAVELGKPMSRDESRLNAEYDLTLREITMRLRAALDNAPGRVALVATDNAESGGTRSCASATPAKEEVSNG